MNPKRLGLIIFCSGKEYREQLLMPFLKNVEAKLKIPFRVHLFTDMVSEKQNLMYSSPLEILAYPYPDYGWPESPMMRYHSILGWWDEFDEEYLLLQDVDMEYVEGVGEEILSPLTVIQRMMYVLRRGMRFPFETNEKSASYIKPQRYYGGGFVLAEKEIFKKLAESIKEKLDYDLKHGYIPIWNEESTLNKVLNDEMEPKKILGPEYNYPPNFLPYYRAIWGRDYKPIIREVEKKWKGNDEVRKMNMRILRGPVKRMEEFYNEHNEG